MNRVVSIVGMAGSGKSEVARIFEERGFSKVRFGDITDEEVRRRGLDLNEQNERAVRESLRNEHGMAAYAKLSLPKIEFHLQNSDVILDGLYSWDEFLLLRKNFGTAFTVIAVWSSPATRYERLSKRTIRPLTSEEAASRDKAEIENLRKGGPIAMADFTICNESTLQELETAAQSILDRMRSTQ